MKRWLLFGCLLAAGTLLPTATRGQDTPPQPADNQPTARAQQPEIPPRKPEILPEIKPAEPPPPPPAPVPIPAAPSCCGPEKILSIPRYTLVEEQRAIAVPRLFDRMETIGTIPGLI